MAPLLWTDWPYLTLACSERAFSLSQHQHPHHTEANGPQSQHPWHSTSSSPTMAHSILLPLKSQTPPAIKTASFPKQAESLYLKNDQMEKQREVNSKQKDHLQSTARGISSGKDPWWTRMFSAVNSDCKKSIGILFHKVWALAQGQKNGTTVLPNNSAKWQPVLSES